MTAATSRRLLALTALVAAVTMTGAVLTAAPARQQPRSVPGGAPHVWATSAPAPRRHAPSDAVADRLGGPRALTDGAVRAVARRWLAALLHREHAPALLRARLEIAGEYAQPGGYVVAFTLDRRSLAQFGQLTIRRRGGVLRVVAYELGSLRSQAR